MAVAIMTADIVSFKCVYQVFSEIVVRFHGIT